MHSTCRSWPNSHSFPLPYSSVSVMLHHISRNCEWHLIPLTRGTWAPPPTSLVIQSDGSPQATLQLPPRLQWNICCPTSRHIISRPEITSEYRVSHNTWALRFSMYHSYTPQFTCNARFKAVDVCQTVGITSFAINKTFIASYYKNFNVFSIVIFNLLSWFK
jgi:hypothetical protein